MSFFSKKSKRQVNNCSFEIDFLKELSTGAIIFKIIDFYNNTAGYVIVCSSHIKIIESGFYDFSTADRDYLRKQAQIFWDAVE